MRLIQIASIAVRDFVHIFSLHLKYISNRNPLQNSKDLQRFVHTAKLPMGSNRFHTIQSPQKSHQNAWQRWSWIWKVTPFVGLRLCRCQNSLNFEILKMNLMIVWKLKNFSPLFQHGQRQWDDAMGWVQIPQPKTYQNTSVRRYRDSPHVDGRSSTSVEANLLISLHNDLEWCPPKPRPAPPPATGKG